MAINSGPINGYAINADTSAILFATISESVQLSPAIEGLRGVAILVAEKLSIILTDTYGGSYDDTISENLHLVDTLVVIFNNTISENLQVVSAVTSKLELIDNILDNLSIVESIGTKSDYSSAVSESLSLIDAITHGILKTISETIGISEGLVDDITALNAIIDQILLAPALSSVQAVSNEIDELMGLADTLSNTVSLSELIADILYLAVNTSKDSEYLSYLLSPETFSVSTYSNYNFTGSCVYNSIPLFINDTGLYKYGGTSDLTDDIVSSIQTAALSFGTSNLKQVPNIYLGLSNSNRLVLKVAVDGQADILYNLTKKTDGLQTQNISIGKGLIGRYFQFELITQESTQFELESLEFLPVTLKRKL